jgi:putative transposase
MSHAVYDTRYHLVWAPKYRKWVLKGELRDCVEEIFNEILTVRDCEVMEMEIAQDHVHIFSSIPPRYSVGEMVRILKCVSAKEIFRRFPQVKRELWGGELGKTDIFTSETIRKYIQYHSHDEKQPKQLKFDF